MINKDSNSDYTKFSLIFSQLTKRNSAKLVCIFYLFSNLTQSNYNWIELN